MLYNPNALPTQQDGIRQVANVAALAVALVLNFLANALPINGQTTGQVSDKFPVYFVPAGYTFSIWGIIYLGLIAFTVYQALPSQRANPTMRRIGYLFAGTSLANSIWIVLWHYELFVLTLLVMLALLAMLVAIYVRLDARRADMPVIELLLVQVPFSIYLAWITVATIANATDVLYLVGWNGWGISGQVWAAVMLIAASLITLSVAIPRMDVAYVAVIVWAYIGIAVKQSSVAVVATTAVLLAAVAVACMLGIVIMRLRTRGTQPGTV